MVKTVRLNKKENYLIDKNGNILEKYDPNIPSDLIIKLDDSMLKVDSSNIKVEYGGQIVVQYNGDKFIIDDGYQNVLVKAGYIVYKDYDVNNIFDHHEGKKLRMNILNDIEFNLSKIKTMGKEDIHKEIYFKRSLDEMELIIEENHYQYTINITTVDNIVLKNKNRKDNSLAFYPFSKNMDKYGTVYISIFAQKISKTKEANEKHRTSHSYITVLINSLGADYHYISQQIKRRLLYHDNM